MRTHYAHTKGNAKIPNHFPFPFLKTAGEFLAPQVFSLVFLIGLLFGLR